MRNLALLILILSCGVQSFSRGEAPEKKPAAPPAGYGFLPPEIYKLDRGVKNLILRDINNDGLLDLIVINGFRNRIDVLRQRTDPNDRTGEESPNETNELVSDWRLRHIKIPALRQIDSLEVKDVNGDKLPDLVYIGEPAGMYVEYQRPDGTFGRRRGFEAPDIQQGSWMLDVGDLNGDGRNDIAYLGKNHLYIVYQRADGQLESPVKYRLTDENAGLLRIVDVDGDGRNDIVYIHDDPQSPVRIRFGSKEGRPGPEKRFAVDRPRGATWGNVDGKPGAELLMVSDLTDRLQVYRLDRPDSDEAQPTSQISTFAFERSGSAPSNDLAVADFDGDGKTDVAVCDSESSRLFLYRQKADEGLDLGTAFPALSGIRSLRVVRVPTEEKIQLLALSDKESAIGWTTFRENRLTYPQSLPTSHEPLAMEVVSDGKQKTRLYYVARARDKGDKYFLRSVEAKTNGNVTQWTTANVGGQPELALNLSGKPSDLKRVDANGDGVDDLLLVFDFQPPQLLLGLKEGGFAAAGGAGQLGSGEVGSAALFYEPIDGRKPELLIAQGNLARKMEFSDGRWKVLDAINASESSASVTGIAALDLDGNGSKELAMYDRGSRSLLFLKRTDGVYRQWKQLKVGAFVLRGMRVGDFDHDGKDDLLLFDADKMGIVYTGRQDLELKQIANYESNIRGGKLEDVAVGDLSGRGENDLLLLEMQQHHLEIVAMRPENKLERVLRWQVFEEKTFRQNFGGKEPREAVIGDLNNDGLNDIAILVHNRVLVYLQDPGPAATAGKENSQRNDVPAGKSGIKGTGVGSSSPAGSAGGRSTERSP